MTVCNGVTVTKMCAFIVSSDTVHLKSKCKPLWHLGFGSTACDPPPVVCMQVPACEVTESVTVGFSLILSGGGLYYEN